MATRDHRASRSTRRDMPALQLRDYDPFTVPRRRDFLIELATADDSWPHRPLNPDLCLVCDDMVAIAADLLADVPPTTDVTPPGIVAEAAPGANVHGWNLDDVVVSLTAEDERNGSGIRDIATTLSGAQPGGGTTPGGSATETIVQEGITTVGYHATDEAGNVSTPETIEVRIDRTAPELTATAEPPANANGWHRGDVLVTFAAFDAMSGLAGEAPPPFLLSEEGPVRKRPPPSRIGRTTSRRPQPSSTSTARRRRSRSAARGRHAVPAASRGDDGLHLRGRPVGVATCEATTMAGTPSGYGHRGGEVTPCRRYRPGGQRRRGGGHLPRGCGFPGFVLAATGRPLPGGTSPSNGNCSMPGACRPETRRRWSPSSRTRRPATPAGDGPGRAGQR